MRKSPISPWRPPPKPLGLEVSQLEAGIADHFRKEVFAGACSVFQRRHSKRVDLHELNRTILEISGDCNAR
jgi:predicted sulfurtransferase